MTGKERQGHLLNLRRFFFFFLFRTFCAGTNLILLLMRESTPDVWFYFFFTLKDTGSRRPCLVLPAHLLIALFWPLVLFLYTLIDLQDENDPSICHDLVICPQYPCQAMSISHWDNSTLNRWVCGLWVFIISNFVCTGEEIIPIYCLISITFFKLNNVYCKSLVWIVWFVCVLYLVTPKVSLPRAVAGFLTAL